jgi:hypothetical protein
MEGLVEYVLDDIDILDLDIGKSGPVDGRHIFLIRITEINPCPFSQKIDSSTVKGSKVAKGIRKSAGNTRRTHQTDDDELTSHTRWAVQLYTDGSTSCRVLPPNFLFQMENLTAGGSLGLGRKRQSAKRLG